MISLAIFDRIILLSAKFYWKLRLIRNMTDSDLLDMHYFLTEDDDLDDDEFEEGFYIDLF